MDPLVTGNVSNTNASSQTISMHKHTNIIYLQFQSLLLKSCSGQAQETALCEKKLTIHTT